MLSNAKKYATLLILEIEIFTVFFEKQALSNVLKK